MEGSTVRWFRRESVTDTAASQPVTGADTDDRPEVLLRDLNLLDRWINRVSDRLPGAVIVRARWITDTLREIVVTAEVRPLEIHAALLVKGTVGDYLPTTLRGYLALDDELQDRPGPSGRTPTQSLLEQLEILQESASRTLVATRNQDVDALTTQGNFLRTKFSRSDLEL
jgi:hypothetical protein